MKGRLKVVRDNLRDKLYTNRQNEEETPPLLTTRGDQSVELREEVHSKKKNSKFQPDNQKNKAYVEETVCTRMRFIKVNKTPNKPVKEIPLKTTDLQKLKLHQVI